MNGFFPGPMQGPIPFMSNQMSQLPVASNISTQQGTSGILSKLLGGLGGSGTGAVNLDSLLGNIQKALDMAERVTPMIEQYGPLIKNAPALLQMFSESSEGDAEAEDENEQKSSKKSKKKSKPSKKAQSQSNEIEVNDETETTEKPKRKVEKMKESVPKLYI